MILRINQARQNELTRSVNYMSGRGQRSFGAEGCDLTVFDSDGELDNSRLGNNSPSGNNRVHQNVGHHFFLLKSCDLSVACNHYSLGLEKQGQRTASSVRHDRFI
jgi:hypothetical protein